MTVKVIINATAENDLTALGYAWHVAKRMHTDLFALSVMPNPDTTVVYTGMDGAVALASGASEAVRKAQAEIRDEITAMFEKFCREEGVPDGSARLEHFSEFPQYVAVREAILGGPLILPGNVANDSHELSPAFERVLMDARLPVVLAPKSPAQLGTAMIAWDGSAEASRALRLHWDLLKSHDRVLIAQNPDDINAASADKHADPEALKAWLNGRQLPCEIVTFKGKVADGLLEVAEKERVDLIVAGAYGHSRLGEFLFGGATRGLLKSANSPALALAH